MNLRTEYSTCQKLLQEIFKKKFSLERKNEIIFYRFKIENEKSVRKMRTLKTGSSLTSRAVSSQVLAAYGCLTSVFGMGTGGPPSHRRRIQLVQIFLCVVVGARRSLRLRLRAFRLAQKNLSFAAFL